MLSWGEGWGDFRVEILDSKDRHLIKAILKFRGFFCHDIFQEQNFSRKIPKINLVHYFYKYYDFNNPSRNRVSIDFFCSLETRNSNEYVYFLL